MSKDSLALLLDLRLSLMETFPESASQGNLFDSNPGPFTSSGNAGAPYMAMFSLPGFTIGLPV